MVGRSDGSGDAYDATLLFERANAAVRTHRCDAAMPDYDRLVQQFPTSRLVPATQYNRGVCLQSMGRADDAVTAYRAAAAQAQEADLVRDAWFRVAVVGESAQRPPLVIEGTNAVLRLPRAGIVDRVEALARQSAALLATGDLSGATRAAQQAVDLAPTPEAVSALQDDTYMAEAKFVLADATRQQAAAIHVVVEDPNLERNIERRVQLVVHSHVQFNDAIRVGNPHWAAACGYTIGEMYRALYDSIVNAQVPADWDAQAIGGVSPADGAAFCDRCFRVHFALGKQRWTWLAVTASRTTIGRAGQSNRSATFASWFSTERSSIRRPAAARHLHAKATHTEARHHK